MILKKIVLHHIIKDVDSRLESKYSKKLLDEKNIIVMGFVDRLVRVFKTKNPTYGMFHSDSKAYPFQSYVQKYLKDDGFFDFTYDSMKLLEKEIDVHGTTGGYVVFVHYQEGKAEFLVTMMLDKSEQFTIDDKNLNIAVLKTLDIEKLARANRINLSKWINKDDSYLAFIKGTRDVSQYFQKFIGNTDLASSTSNCNSLKKAMQEYMKEKEFNVELKDKINKDVFEYMDKSRLEDKDVFLDAISSYVNHELPRDFIDYVQMNDDLHVSGNFRITKKSDIKYFYKATISEKGYKLEFDKELLKTSKVVIEKNNVTITNVPQEKIDDLLND
ncbi:MAG: nucleoid-associated protein [Fibrobacterales bacterium]